MFRSRKNVKKVVRGWCGEVFRSRKNVKKVVRDWGQNWQKREKGGAGLGPG